MVSLLDKHFAVFENQALTETGRNLLLEEIVIRAGPEHAEKALEFWEEQLINKARNPYSGVYSVNEIVYATNRLREYKDKLYIMLKLYPEIK